MDQNSETLFPQQNLTSNLPHQNDYTQENSQESFQQIDSQHSNLLEAKEHSAFKGKFRLNDEKKLLNVQEIDFNSVHEQNSHKFCSKLKVKVENGFSLKLEEKTNSNSTSASTPLEYVRTNSSNSAYSNEEREAQNLVLRENQIERDLAIESNVENENAINIQNSSNNSIRNSLENIQEQSAQNQSLNETNDEHINNHQNINNESFSDSLDFILTKTPVLSIFMALICLALASGVGISFLEEKYTHTYLFVILYVFLLYLLIERIFRLLKDIPRNNMTFTHLVQRKCFYNYLDIKVYLFLALVANLWLSEIIDSLVIGLYALISSFTFYCVFYKGTLKEKVLGIAKRLFLIVQFYVIVRKADNEIALSWKLVFCAGWIMLGGFWIRVWDCISKILTAFSGQNIFSILSRQAKIIGMFALVMILADVVILMMVWVGVCKVLDEENEGIEYLKTWLTVSQYLNAVLLFYGTITGVDLIEFILTANEYFNGTSPQTMNYQKKRNLVFSQKEIQVLRISQTYYKVFEEKFAEQFFQEEKEHKSSGNNEAKNTENEENKLNETEKSGNEENTCYICCGKDANGVVLTCGHGGICYECLLDYINKKDECMECRRKIESILKIEEEVKCGKVFKGNKVCQIERT